MTQPDTLWQPSEGLLRDSAMARFLRRAGDLDASIVDYASLHAWSVGHADEFWRLWLEESGMVHEGRPLPTEHDNPSTLGGNFFPNLKLNFAENLLRHRGDRPAVHGLSEGGGAGEGGDDRTLTHDQLFDQVRRLQKSLIDLGVGPGDRVAGILPNIPEAVVAMLATTSLGAIWSSCSPDFGTQGMLKRFAQIQPRVLISADGYRYASKDFSCRHKLEEVAVGLDGLQTVVWIETPAGDEMPPDLAVPVLSWTGATALTDHRMQFPRFPFNHPIYILYSSGTTGVPKCIVHGAGGTLLQHSKELILHSDLRPDDNLLYFTTCGWMMWTWLVSGLYTGAAITLYDGSPAEPEIDALWEAVARKKVTHAGTSPKYIGSCRGAVTPREKFDLSALRVVLSTGAPLLEEDFDWIYTHVSPDVLLASISGGTDIISCFMLGNPLLPVLRGEIQAAGLGMDIAAFDDRGQPVFQKRGELVCRRSFPSMPVSFWNDPGEEKYRGAYFREKNDVWYHGDYIEMTQTHGDCGGVVVFGRSDATLNPAGVRIGTAEIYSLVETLPWVQDSIVVGQPHAGDVRIVLFVQARGGESLTEARVAEVRSLIRQQASPRHVPAFVLETPEVPYTLSGKKVELAVREVLAGRAPANEEALANPASLVHFRNRPELQ